MIKLVRVDHRLLHGQVIFSWTRQTAANHIIVADDLGFLMTPSERWHCLLQSRQAVH